MIRRLMIVVVALVVAAAAAFGAQMGYDAYRDNEPSADATAPMPPASINASALSGESILVVWSTPDGPSVDRYEIERNGVPIAMTTLLSFVDLELEPETAYTYRVRANAGDQWSPYSAPITFRTKVANAR